jgi:hypothetical protein
MRGRKSAYVAALGTVAVAALGVSLAIAATRSGAESATPRSSATPPMGTSTTVLEQRFAVLNRQDTNKCGLRAESLESIAVDGRLQGSCCSPMKLQRYVEQVRGLVRYRSVPQIPADPYDISVTQARQLLAYDHALNLSASQQATYRRAMKLSHEHGPCCCHCWRWSAFEGQAKYLIARRGYGASRIAQIWNLEDGCGGSA